MVASALGVDFLLKAGPTVLNQSTSSVSEVALPSSATCNAANFAVVGLKWFAKPTTDFFTASMKLVPSNLPTNPEFVKKRDDTYLWVFLSVDIVPTAFNSAFNAIMMDDSIDLLQVSIAGPPKELIVANMTDIFPGKNIPAGLHTFKLYVASNGGTCQWLTPQATFKILEVSMPPLQQ